MKCKECGAHLPYGAFGHIRCEFCNTPNYVPVPKEKREPYIPTKIEKRGNFSGLIGGMFCNFTVGEEEKHEVTIHKSMWSGRIIVKVDGKKTKTFMVWLGGKKEHIIEIGEKEKNYIKIVVDVPKIAPGIRKWKYEVYVN